MKPGAITRRRGKMESLVTNQGERKKRKSSASQSLSIGNKTGSRISRQKNGNQITIGETPSARNGDLSSSDESSTSGISNSEDEKSLEEQLEIPTKKTTPPTSVAGKASAVSTITNAKDVTIRRDIINPQTGSYRNGKVSDKRVKNDLRGYLRKYWYKGVKFINCDKIAREYLQDAITSESVVIPTGMTHDAFCDKYQSGINTAMSQIRHNSQLLARKNYLGKYSIKKNVIYRNYKTLVALNLWRCCFFPSSRRQKKKQSTGNLSRHHHGFAKA